MTFLDVLYFYPSYIFTFIIYGSYPPIQLYKLHKTPWWFGPFIRSLSSPPVIRTEGPKLICGYIPVVVDINPSSSKVGLWTNGFRVWIVRTGLPFSFSELSSVWLYNFNWESNNLLKVITWIRQTSTKEIQNLTPLSCLDNLFPLTVIVKSFKTYLIISRSWDSITSGRSITEPFFYWENVFIFLSKNKDHEYESHVLMTGGLRPSFSRHVSKTQDPDSISNLF